MRVWPGILIVVLCAMLPASVRAQGKSYALVVGIDIYYYPSDFPKLTYCAKDAREISQTLSRKCDYPANNVTLLRTGGAKPPTKREIEEALRAIMSEANDEDTVLFYFSGHGLEVDKSGQVAGPKTPDKEREGLLVTADCEIRNAGSTGLKLSEVKRILSGGEGGKSPKCKFLVLDCCHAGANSTKDKASDDPAHRLTQNLGELASVTAEKKRVLNFQQSIKAARGTITLASCMSHQKSLEDDENGHGLFTHYLLQGLSGDADRDLNGIVDHLELYSHLVMTVPVGAKDITGEPKQSPVLYLGPDTTGLFALAKTSKGPPPQPGQVQPVIMPHPSAKAIAAEGRLAKKDFSDWKGDTAILLDEIKNKFSVKAPNLLQTPFHDATTSERVAKYLSLVLEAQGGELVPPHLPGLLIVAEFYSSSDPDISTERFDSLAQAAGLTISLEPFVFEIPSDSALALSRGHLLHAYAVSRSIKGTASRRSATLAYDELVKLITQEEARTHSQIAPLEQYELYEKRVLKLLDALGDVPATDTELRNAMGRLCGQYVLSMDNQQNFEKLPALCAKAAIAVATNPDEPSFTLASIAAQLNKDVDDAKDPTIDNTILVRLGTTLDELLLKLKNGQERKIDRAIALRLRGDIYAYESRLADCQGPIGSRIQSAIEAYSQAITTFQELPEPSRNSKYRRLKNHYADCLLGRSSMHIDWANKVVAKNLVMPPLDANATTKERHAALKRALEDARKFENLVPARGVIARRNVGNAYEDLAYLAGDMSAYGDAISVFKGSLEAAHVDGTSLFDPQVWTDLGRAQYKAAYQVRYGDSVRPGESRKPNGLADTVLNLTEALKVSPSNHEARAILGQVAFRTGDLAGALDHFKDSLSDSSFTGTSRDQKMLARDSASLQWVWLEAQVNKAILENLIPNVDFTVAEKCAQELPPYDLTRSRIMGEIAILKARYLMVRRKKDPQAAALEELGTCLKIANGHMRDCLGIGTMQPGEAKECAESKSASLVFSAAVVLIECQMFGLEEQVPFDGGVATRQDVINLCQEIDQVAKVFLATDSRLREVSGRLGIFVAKFANLRDRSFTASAEPWLAKALPKDLSGKEEYSGQWRCTHALASVKAEFMAAELRTWKNPKTPPNQQPVAKARYATLKREVLSNAEFAGRNCLEDKVKADIENLINVVKKLP